MNPFMLGLFGTLAALSVLLALPVALKRKSRDRFVIAL
jgi:hypothetical protein